METNASKVLNFLVAKEVGSETQPTRLGNVEFWHPVPGYPVGLCYDIPVNRWNVEQVQQDINKLASKYWDELVNHLTAE